MQAALNACKGKGAVKLTSSGANNAFVTGPLKVDGVVLWVDTGTTLYASRNPSSYGCSASGAANACGSFLSITGTKPGIVGDGTIDGQGGEPMMGSSQSWWDVSDGLRASNGSAANPSLIDVSNATNFVLYKTHIYNSPKFHVKLSSDGFVVWGATVLTPSKSTNSQGKALTPYGARNTDGIDPGGGQGTTRNGYVVCSKISVGDDQVAIKGGNSQVDKLTFAHNHFGTGHGMSIGSETNAGVSNITVNDLTIDGSIPTGGSPASDVNGLRIKSDASRGGLVTGITYTDVCVRDVPNPILLNPNYSSNTGSLYPHFTNVTIKNFHSSSTGMQTVTLDGYNASHISVVTLDGVVVDNAPTIASTYAAITIGSGGISFAPPSGTGVTVQGSQGSPQAIDCSSRWVTF